MRRFLLTVGSFLLTVELFYLQLTILAFLLTPGAFLLTVLASLLTIGAFFDYSGKVRLIRAWRDCKQRSLTVSKKAPTVSKKSFPQFKFLDNFYDVIFTLQRPNFGSLQETCCNAIKYGTPWGYAHENPDHNAYLGAAMVEEQNRWSVLRCEEGVMRRNGRPECENGQQHVLN